jgi:hypothetical protein
VSMSTGRWSELSAEHEARYTEEGISLVITMSKTSGVAEGVPLTREGASLYSVPLLPCLPCDWLVAEAWLAWPPTIG